MERFEELRFRAIEKIRLADHMLMATFPMIKDPKILPVVLQNIFLAMTYAMQSILLFELYYKRIPIFEDTLKGRMEAFRKHCMDRFRIDHEVVNTIREIRHILVLHEKSPTEFVRHDRYVICSDDYSTTQVTEVGVRRYLQRAKDFVNTASLIVKKEKIA